MRPAVFAAAAPESYLLLVYTEILSVTGPTQRINSQHQATIPT